jgi:hypothetical protein
MRRFTIGLLAVALTFVVCSRTQAGLLTSVLTFSGEVNEFQDNSVARAFNADGTPLGATDSFGIGTVIAGFVRLEERTDPSFLNLDTVGEFALAFSVTVDSDPIDLGGGFFGFTHSPTLAAHPFSVASMLSSFGASFSDPDALVAALLTAPLGTTTPISQTMADGITNLNSGAWDLDLTVGFANPQDFFHVRLQDQNGDGAITPADFVGVAGSVRGSEHFGLSVIDALSLAGAPLIPLPQETMPGFPGFPAITFHDVRGTGDLRVPTSVQAGNGWQLQDDLRIAINAVPEPGSMTLLAIGLVAVGAVHLRRRRKQAPANSNTLAS